MKFSILILTLVFISSSVIASELRDFQSADGKTVTAKIVYYDSLKKKVTLETLNRKRHNIPIKALCSEDQTYIAEWDKNQKFMSDRFLTVEIKRQKRSASGEGYSGYNNEEKVKKCTFEVTLSNKSKIPLKNLEMEYCIFYEQDEHRKTNQGVLYAKTGLEQIPAKGKIVVETEKVSIYKHSLDSDWYYTSGAKNVQKGKVHGIYLKVHMTNESGKVITREICQPSGVAKYGWKTSSKAVGKNR